MARKATIMHIQAEIAPHIVILQANPVPENYYLNEIINRDYRALLCMLELWRGRTLPPWLLPIAS